MSSSDDEGSALRGRGTDEETPLLSSSSPSTSRQASSSRTSSSAGDPFRDDDYDAATDVDESPGDLSGISPSIGSHQTDVAEAHDAATHPLAKAVSSSSSVASDYLAGVSNSRFWVVFAGLMFTYSVVIFDSTLLASSHPIITSYFGASHAASWLSTSYLLTSTAFQPFVGRASDSVGRKPIYVAALVVFGLATLWCALAGSIAQFIAARAVCGLSAGAMMIMANICIGDLVPVERRGPFQSFINFVYGISSMSGAALGGILADSLGWRWEFGVQIPFLLLCLLVIIIALPDNIGLHGRPRESLSATMKVFDFRGSILITLTATCLILGLDLGGSVLPWSHPLIVISLASAVFVFIPLLLHVEARAARPVMPLELIRRPPFMNLIVANHIAAFVMNAILFNAPIFFQAVLLTSATSSGLRLALPSAVASIAGIATGFLISYTRRLKWAPLLGATLYLVGACMLASMRRSWHSDVLYLACLVPAALGQGFQFPGTYLALLAAADHSAQAVLTTTLALWRSLGTVAGIAVSSVVLQAALGSFLDAYVQDGPGKADVIRRVRASVGAVKQLPEPYQSQVARSYEAALSVMFAGCAALALVSVLLILPVRLPRLRSKAKHHHHNHHATAGEGGDDDDSGT